MPLTRYFNKPGGKPSEGPKVMAAMKRKYGEKGGERLRSALVRLGVAEVRALLLAGDPVRGVEAVESLRRRNARSAELQVLEETARGWHKARDLADHGEFARELARLAGEYESGKQALDAHEQTLQAHKEATDAHAAKLEALKKTRDELGAVAEKMEVESEPKAKRTPGPKAKDGTSRGSQS